MALWLSICEGFINFFSDVVSYHPTTGRQMTVHVLHHELKVIQIKKKYNDMMIKNAYKVHRISSIQRFILGEVSDGKINSFPNPLHLSVDKNYTTLCFA